MLVDSHCHIPHQSYVSRSERRDVVALAATSSKMLDQQVIDEAAAEGVDKLISVGTCLADLPRIYDVINSFSQVYGTAGVYPHEDKNESLEDLRGGLECFLAKGEKFVGVGECGFDTSSNWKDGRTLTEQYPVFEMQIELAIKYDLPLVLHNRGADKESLEVLAKHTPRGLKGVAHCFSSDWDVAKKFLDLNFYLSFSGVLTYPSARNLSEVARRVPEDRYLVETDAPYLPPQGHRGEVNYPKYVKIVALKMAQVRGESFEKVCRDSHRNTCTLFKI